MCDRRILSVFSCDETWLGLIFGKMTVCPAWRRDFQKIRTGSKERNDRVESLGDVQQSYSNEDDWT